MQKNNNLTIGFSTGCFFKTHDIHKSIALLKEAGITDAIELNLLRTKELVWYSNEATQEELDGFRYVSVHGPKFNYDTDWESAQIMKRIETIHAKRQLNQVIFHPDTVKNFSVFKNLPFPIAFENLDHREESGIYRTPEGMKTLFDEFPSASMVLDVNHVYTLDQSMQYAKKFYAMLGDRIKQIHLSGYKDMYYTPLFQTKQKSIIRAIKQSKETPIIIESVLKPEDIEKEMNYIVKYLK